MGMKIPIDEIEQFQDDYLWDDLQDHINLMKWELGIDSWSDISENEEEDQIIIENILDRYEEQQEIIDCSELIYLLE